MKSARSCPWLVRRELLVARRFGETHFGQVVFLHVHEGLGGVPDGAKLPQHGLNLTFGQRPAMAQKLIETMSVEIPHPRIRAEVEVHLVLRWIGFQAKDV